jgi:hypothetical protein
MYQRHRFLIAVFAALASLAPCAFASGPSDSHQVAAYTAKKIKKYKPPKIKRYKAPKIIRKSNRIH